jgi:hypothetical protein
MIEYINLLKKNGFGMVKLKEYSLPRRKKSNGD